MNETDIQTFALQLARIENDLKWIKEQLVSAATKSEHLDDRLRKTESKAAWISGLIAALVSGLASAFRTHHP